MNCKAQIIPIEQHKTYLDNETEIPDGAYLNNVNDLLDKFVGTWSGNINGVYITFYINEVIHQSNIRPISIDELRMRYKLTDANGNVIFDTTGLPNDSHLIVRGMYLTSPNLYVMSYVGEDGQCGQQGQILMGIPQATPNTMNVYYAVVSDAILREDCPNGEVAQVMPEGQFVLTRQ